MNFLCFNDPQGAGPAVARAVARRGHDVSFDRIPRHADAAYIRTLNYGQWRAMSLDWIRALRRQGAPTLPSYENSLLYDDKLAQLPVLERWLPKTLHITKHTTAPEGLDVPFISKTAHGSASKNVRLISTWEQAYQESWDAFGAGIPLAKGVQRGYLYWQEFILGNDHDIRVVVNGENLYGLRRFVRSEAEPFASGSGKNEPIRSLDDPFVRRAFELAREISAAIPSRWCAMDFVRDPVTERVYGLEVSFSWSEKAYAECLVFDAATLAPNGRKGAEWAEFAVDEMERLVSSRL